jgi:hypothetical protein
VLLFCLWARMRLTSVIYAVYLDRAVEKEPVSTGDKSDCIRFVAPGVASSILVLQRLRVPSHVDWCVCWGLLGCSGLLAYIAHVARLLRPIKDRYLKMYKGPIQQQDRPMPQQDGFFLCANSACSCRFRTDSECYACGGSGSLFKSLDGGQSFKRQKGLDQVPGNLYTVAFSTKDVGFVLGNDGILLRYIPRA